MHEITLVSLARPGESVEEGSPLRELCKEVDLIPWFPTTYESRDYIKRLLALPSARPFDASQSVSADCSNRIRQQLEHQVFDAVICDMVYILPNLPPGLSVPVAVDTQHVAHGLLQQYLMHIRNPVKRLYVWMEYSKTRRWEARVCSQVQAVWACSGIECTFFRQFCPGVQVMMVPNVIDVGAYHPSPDSDGATVLFSGIMDWYPNQNAVHFFASEMFPKLRRMVPGVRFRVAGRGGGKEFLRPFAKVPEIEFTGFVQNMRAEIAKAAVCVVPLRIGSGTRLKILEAAAMAKPIVSTRLGAEGLDFVDGKEILLADEPEAFARAVAGLLGDASRRRELGRAARRRVEESYSLPVLRTAVRTALAGLTEGCLVRRR